MGRFIHRASACKQAAGGFIWFENKSQFLPKWSSQFAAALSPHAFLLTKQRQRAPLLGRKRRNIQGPLHWPFCHGGRGQASHAATGGAAGGEWTNAPALTQFDRKWYCDFRVMPMDRILKRVAMSSVPTFTRRVSEKGIYSHRRRGVSLWLNISAYISRQSGALSITSSAAGKHTALDARAGNQVCWPDVERNRSSSKLSLAPFITPNVSSCPSVLIAEGIINTSTLQWPWFENQIIPCVEIFIYSIYTCKCNANDGSS